VAISVLCRGLRSSSYVLCTSPAQSVVTKAAAWTLAQVGTCAESLGLLRVTTPGMLLRHTS
jgi:hypothetical protein